LGYGVGHEVIFAGPGDTATAGEQIFAAVGRQCPMTLRWLGSVDPPDKIMKALSTGTFSNDFKKQVVG